MLCVLTRRLFHFLLLVVSFVPTSSHRQSYDISIVAQVDQTGSKSSNLLDLKNPFFRWVGHIALESSKRMSATCVADAVLCSAGTLAQHPPLLQVHIIPRPQTTCGTQEEPTAWAKAWVCRVHYQEASNKTIPDLFLNISISWSVMHNWSAATNV